jgi:hypothetical protein
MFLSIWITVVHLWRKILIYFNYDWTFCNETGIAANFLSIQFEYKRWQWNATDLIIFINSASSFNIQSMAILFWHFQSLQWAWLLVKQQQIKVWFNVKFLTVSHIQLFWNNLGTFKALLGTNLSQITLVRKRKLKSYSESLMNLHDISGYVRVRVSSEEGLGRLIFMTQNLSMR